MNANLFGPAFHPGNAGEAAVTQPSAGTSSIDSSFSNALQHAILLSPPLSATGGNPAAQLQPNNGGMLIPLDDKDKGSQESARKDQDEELDNRTSTRKKKKRTKSGCITCRKRKVKCGEEKPTCQRCYQARVECAGYPVPTTKIHKCSNATSSNEDNSRRSSTTSSSVTTSSSSSNSAHSNASNGAGSPSSQEPVRKAVRLITTHGTESPASYSLSPPQLRNTSLPASYIATTLHASAGAGSVPSGYSRSPSKEGLLKRKTLSSVSISSMSTTNSAPVHPGAHTSHSSLSARSDDTIATAPALSRAGSTGSLQPRFATATTLSASHTPSSGIVSDFNGNTSHRYRASPSQRSFSPTLAPPLQPQLHQSQMQINENTFAPFAFDSPFPLQPFASTISPLPQDGNSNNNSQSIAAGAGVKQPGNTPIGFDSLFGYTGNNMQHQQDGAAGLNDNGNGHAGLMDGSLPGAPLPLDYWEDADFIDRIMSGFRDSTGDGELQVEFETSVPAESQLQINLENPATSRHFDYEMPSNTPSLSSGRSSILSPTARTPSTSSPAVLPVFTQDPQMSSHLVADTQSSRSTKNNIRNKNRSVSAMSQRASVISNIPTAASTNTTMADFAPQPAIDPILQGTSTLELHKQAANRNKIIPSLNELAMGPPPNLLGNQKEWSIPSKIAETMQGMSNSRHVELLKHYFINLVGLFSPIDHPKNPFRTFVAEHATESLSLLHAVLAVSAINQQPLSAEARAESLLYFEAAVDLYVRSLQQQDDISLFTLLFLSLYYAFDSGTAQPQHFSRRAQNIINERLELLAYDVLQTSNDFRFLVRLHVWHEVMANISRRAGDLRDMACGQYTLSHLLSIVQKWDIQEEKAAALSGVNPDFIMTGCVGVPTFFVSLLNDISLLKEEQHTILSIPIGNLDEQGRFLRKVIISKHTSKIRDLECKIQFARPGRLLVPPIVANELALHRAVSVRFFDLFRLAASIHLLSELQGTPVNDSAIQLRTTEMVNLLGNIEQNSNYNTSGIWAFFIAGAAASNHMDRIALHRRLDSTWNSPCGNVWSLRSILDEVWQRNAEALENNEPCQNWKEVAQQRGWLLLLM